jgi:hypothetical protein
MPINLSPQEYFLNFLNSNEEALKIYKKAEVLKYVRLRTIGEKELTLDQQSDENWDGKNDIFAYLVIIDQFFSKADVHILTFVPEFENFTVVEIKFSPTITPADITKSVKVHYKSEKGNHINLLIADPEYQLQVLKDKAKRDGYNVIQDPWIPNVVNPKEQKSVDKSSDKIADSKNDDDGFKTVNEPEIYDYASLKEPKVKADEITGEIWLEKVSGPGDIIGDGREIIDSLGSQRGVKFEDLQFTEPGDYVIRVLSDSPNLTPTQFNITVLPEPVIIPQEKVVEEEQEEVVLGARPMITQIFPPTLKLRPITVKYEEETGTATVVTADGMGIFPTVYYNGVPISHGDILSFRLYHDGVVPKCKVSFIDSANLIKDLGVPKDDMTFDIFINSKTVSLKSIHLNFKLEKHRESMFGAKYTFNGTLNIPSEHDKKFKLYEQQSPTYEQMTSYNAITNICKDLGIGFNSNISDTDDKMTWVFNGDKGYQVIEHLVNKSYISDSSFMGAYIDYYYCMNYVDVEKECRRDNSNDSGIETGGVGSNSSDNEQVQMLLHNEVSANKSSFFFLSEPKIKHNSTDKNLIKGVRTKVKFYDNKTKKFEVYDIEGTTSDGTETEILKGSPNDKKGFFSNTTTRMLGKMDTENVHKNYLYAEELNRRNLDELGNIEMIVKLPTINLNYYIYQKTRVVLVNQRTSPTNQSRFRYEYTGDWTISAIEFKMTKEGGMKTFYQEMRLIRKELGMKPKDQMERLEPKTGSEENVPNSVNPIENFPNAAYQPSEVYRFKDENGMEWIVSIIYPNSDGETMEVYMVSDDLYEDTNAIKPIPTFDDENMIPDGASELSNESPTNSSINKDEIIPIKLILGAVVPKPTKSFDELKNKQLIENDVKNVSGYIELQEIGATDESKRFRLYAVLNGFTTDDFYTKMTGINPPNYITTSTEWLTKADFNKDKPELDKIEEQLNDELILRYSYQELETQNWIKTEVKYVQLKYSNDDYKKFEKKLDDLKK